MNKFIALLIVTIIFAGCKPEWQEGEKESYINKGKTVAQATAKRMLGEVGKNMKEGGVAQAVPYCQAYAPELTKEIAAEHNVTIRRTSHKLRNPNNAPTADEQKKLDTYLDLIADKAALKPMVEKDAKGNVHFYAPILLLKKCTVCHGVPGETLNEKNYEMIKSLYPEDQATGFAEGDFRGMWHITFNQS